MAFDWATEKQNYCGNLVIKTMGVPGNTAPASISVTTDIEPLMAARVPAPAPY